MKTPVTRKKNFTRDLLKWHREKNTRELPWKGEKDPYRVWLSEVILQQTRVEQGLGYYQKFLESYPDIHQLAKAPEEQVFKLWEGLGYYSRCRNLVATARMISTELNGTFPSQYESILGLKGVGPYTAAAISSFAFGLPHAVVDGNVFRVLSRVFGISKDISSGDGKTFFTQLANELLSREEPAAYNQAIMDFGAGICKPANPLCNQCPFNKYCVAYNEEQVELLPVKGKKLRIKERWFYYVVAEYQNKLVINKRSGKDIWKDLYEFILVETERKEEVKEVIRHAVDRKLLKKDQFMIESVSTLQTQKLSHQKINGYFIKVRLNKKPQLAGTVVVTRNELKNYAFPALINSYFNGESWGF